VQVLRAGTDNLEEDEKGGFWQVSSTDPMLASRLPSAEDFATGCSHFIPFEDPGLVARVIEGADLGKIATAWGTALGTTRMSRL
jgi:hypothetical protein